MSNAGIAEVKRTIMLRFQRVGFHAYPGAPEDVSYLESRHRHLFKFQVEISVDHNERELEFHQVLNFIEKQYDAGTLEMNSKSCESIAEELCKVLQSWYGNHRNYTVEVWEDGECGSRISYNNGD